MDPSPFNLLGFDLRNEHCFFCLNHPKDGQLQTNSIFSLRCLLHYLKLGHVKLEGAYPQLVVICETCSKPLQKFQRLFRLWLEIEMKLCFCLEEIRGQLSTKSNSANISKVRDLREKLEQKCSLKILAYQPELKLKDLQSRTQSPDPMESDSSNSIGNDTFSLSDGPDSKPEVERTIDLKCDIHTCTLSPFPKSKPDPNPPIVSRLKKAKAQKKTVPGRKKKVTDCSFCHKRFSIHYKPTHELICPKNPADRRPKTCRFCRKDFPGGESLKVHIDQVHGSELTFRCEICGHRFKHGHAFHKHKREVHHNGNDGQRFNCNWCGKVFVRLSALRRHMDGIHLQIKKFGCDMCGKRYSQKSSLKAHKGVAHLGERFRCQEAGCVLTYISKTGLEVHILRDHKAGNS